MPQQGRVGAAVQPRGPPLTLGASFILAAVATLGVQTTVAAKTMFVTTPILSKAPGQEFSVGWSYSAAGDTTGDLNGFNIELRDCGTPADGSSCEGGDACGTDYADLCTSSDGSGEGICTDSDGRYDVIIPEDAPAGKYAIKVALHEDPTIFACCSAFDVELSEGEDAIESGEPRLEAFAPDPVLAGEPFTATWAYDDGAGNTGGAFDINLFICADNGDCEDDGCGTLAEALCNNLDGCYDPGTGDYDVTVPVDQVSGTYKLQVKNRDDQTAHCSDSFFVTGETGAVPTLAPAETPVQTRSPTPAPFFPATPSPVVPTEAPVVPLTRAPSPEPTPQPVAPPAAQPVVPPTPRTAPPTQDTTPIVLPNPVPAKVECDDSAELSFKYTKESSTKLPLITVTHASGDRTENGCLTLTMLYEWLQTAPSDVLPGLLYTVDESTGIEVESSTASPTGTWLLSSSVEVTNGVTFEIKGTSAGGDCDYLKVSSTKKRWFRIMGYGGNLDIDSTDIRSWDPAKDKEHIFKDSTEGKEARSFISCVSEVEDPGESCAGVAQNNMGECRMDIISSELGYLGYDSTEAYGITWKVRGLCENLSNQDSLFDSVRVYGDMIDSEIHHMWYGMYSYGHLGGVWTHNKMHNNWVYGFDPHDDSDYLTIYKNTVYNNGNHGIIASKRCDHLNVTENTVYDNYGSGIMLHKMCDDSVVSGNVCTSNFDAGISLVETSRCTVVGNTFEANRWGFRVILGSSDNLFDGNDLFENTYSDIYAYYGAAEEVSEVDPFTGINVNNVFSNNYVEHDEGTTVDIEDSDGTELSSNFFTGAKPANFVFLRSDNTHLVDNTGDAADGTLDDITDSCFTADSDRLPVCSS